MSVTGARSQGSGKDSAFVFAHIIIDPGNPEVPVIKEDASHETSATPALFPVTLLAPSTRTLEPFATVSPAPVLPVTWTGPPTPPIVAWEL
jgi:hypothetical protein